MSSNCLRNIVGYQGNKVASNPNGGIHIFLHRIVDLKKTVGSLSLFLYYQSFQSWRILGAIFICLKMRIFPVSIRVLKRRKIYADNQKEEYLTILIKDRKDIKNCHHCWWYDMSSDCTQMSRTNEITYNKKLELKP